jgi:hypothetical protein
MLFGLPLMEFVNFAEALTTVCPVWFDKPEQLGDSSPSFVMIVPLALTVPPSI